MTLFPLLFVALFFLFFCRGSLVFLGLFYIKKTANASVSVCRCCSPDALARLSDTLCTKKRSGSPRRIAGHTARHFARFNSATVVRVLFAAAASRDLSRRQQCPCHWFPRGERRRRLHTNPAEVKLSVPRSEDHDGHGGNWDGRKQCTSEVM